MKRLQIDRRSVLAGAAALISATSLSAFAQTTQQALQTAVLFQNVRVFDGKGTALSAPANVLVRGNTIERISAQPISVDRGANTTIVNGNPRASALRARYGSGHP